jgi:uncharacterized membrane protein
MGESGMVGFLLALLIGVVAGLRAMTAPAVVSWATNLGTYDPENFTYESSSAFAENKSSILRIPTSNHFGFA